jgi:hypothetical protein
MKLLHSVVAEITKWLPLAVSLALAGLRRRTPHADGEPTQAERRHSIRRRRMSDPLRSSARPAIFLRGPYNFGPGLGLGDFPKLRLWP